MTTGDARYSWINRWGSISGFLVMILTFLIYIYNAGQWQAKITEGQTRTQEEVKELRQEVRTDYVRSDVLTPKLQAISDTLKEVKDQQRQINEYLISPNVRRRGPS